MPYADKEVGLKKAREYKKKNAASVAAVQRAKTQKRRRQLVASAGGKCVDCGGVYPPWVFDFHHRDPSTKEFNVAKSMSISMARLEAEVAKCDLLCSNCHRMRHHGKDDLPSDVPK